MMRLVEEIYGVAESDEVLYFDFNVDITCRLDLQLRECLCAGDLRTYTGFTGNSMPKHFPTIFANLSTISTK